MVLVAVGGQGRADARVELRGLRREQRVVPEVHEGLVRVVAEEGLHVLGQPQLRVQRPGVGHLVVVQVLQQLVDLPLQLLALLRGEAEGLDLALILVADVVAVDGLVADDQADQVGGVGETGVGAQVQRPVEPRVEQERLQQGAGGLAAQRRQRGRRVRAVVPEDEGRLELEVGVVPGPPEGLVDAGGARQGAEDRGVRLRVHRLHEGDVGVDGFLVGGERIGDQAHRPHRALDGVQQGQPREHVHGGELLPLRHGLPGGEVRGQRHLLGEPEVVDQALPDLQVLVVGDVVPVDRLGDAGLRGHGWFLRRV